MSTSPAVPDTTLRPPAAPGALGAAIASPAILAYLGAVSTWRDGLHARLVALDERAKVARIAADVVPDVTLAFALWQSISARVDELTATWDSGRVGQQERERIAQLIWGRLDGNAGGGGLAVSFVEACVLADSLTSRLAERLDADGLGRAGVGDRVGPMRDQLERCRTQAAILGTGLDQVRTLAAQLDDAISRAAAGGDVRVDLDHIDRSLNGLERDLIIVGATRTGLAKDVAALQSRLAVAVAKAAEVKLTAARCEEKIAGAPHLAVPSPAALGPVPPADTSDWRGARAAVDSFAQRLGLVEEALRVASGAYSTPLAERDDLRGLLQGYRAKAAHLGAAEDPELTAAYEAARSILWSAPCDLGQGRLLVAAYQQLVVARAGPTATGGEAPKMGWSPEETEEP